MAKLTIPHPGIHLAEFLTDYNLSAYRLAKDIGVPQTRISHILKGKRAITADTALRLGRYFGTTTQMWVNLQGNYDIDMATIAAGKSLKSIKPIASSVKAA